MQSPGKDVNIIYLHHSTGNCVWQGGVDDWFENYNLNNQTNYRITRQAFPQKEPYGWNNYPFDYWNIWVKNAGSVPFMDEPTLEMLTEDYDVVVFKHCFPVSQIEADTGKAEIDCSEKRLENYKLQYAALKQKLHQFPQTRFIVWTGAALVKDTTTPPHAKRAREFAQWVKNDWNEPGDNIFVWDFFELETEGGLYLKNEYANGEKDPHPNEAFCKKVAPDLCELIVSVIEGNVD